MFSSYEAGRSGYVTLLANYQPVQNPAGGPNFDTLDPAAWLECTNPIVFTNLKTGDGLDRVIAWIRHDVLFEAAAS